MEQMKWKELFMKYNVQIGVVVAVILVVAVAALAGGGSAANQESTAEEAAQGSDAETTEDTAEAVEEEPNELEEKTHASIERLIERYCEYMASGDVDSLEAIVDVLTDEDKASIQSRSAFIEAYENVTSYTKDGPVEDSYIVFVCYDMKLINIETSAPDIICLYVGPKDESGNRLIHYGDIDESMQEYVAELEQDPDVQALYDDVRTRYQQAQEQDPTLAEFIQRISGELTEESAESQETTETTETEETEEPAEETADTAEAGETAESAETAEETGEGTVLNRQTRVAESVNMRAEASTDSERLALIYQGETVTQIQAYDNGWSQIEYNGVTGYVMTEYLEGSSASADTSGEEQSAGTSSESRQTRVTESVNMRGEASTDSERLALIYPGETVTQIQSYDNGWSQIEYNGMTGYILTEYLE